MKWILILFLLSLACCKKQQYFINYEPLTDEEMKCILKNVKPIDKNSNEVDSDYIVTINEKLYEWTDPKFQECLKE